MSHQFTLRTQQFEGPLGLLLTLIQERKLYINEVSLAEVTDEYLLYVQQYRNLPVAETSDFIVVASTLLLIKSRSLLPGLEMSEEEESDIQDLERRLQYYRVIKEAARGIRTHWNQVPLAAPGFAPEIAPSFAPGELTAARLEQAALQLVEMLPTASFRATASVEATKTLEEVLEDIKRRIVRRAELRFSDIRQSASRADLIIHFLAILELVRGGSVQAHQEGTFSDIVVQSEDVEAPRYGA